MPLLNGGSVGGVGPQKFDADMTEIKSKLDNLQTDVTTIDTNVDTINTNVDSLLEDVAELANDHDTLLSDHQTIISKLNVLQTTVADIQGSTGTIIAICNDILLGRQISEWIADLAASGKSSATYADSSRMQTLIGNTDACKNVTVNQHILDWGIANNKTGTFFNSYLSGTGGVSWSSLTTPNSIFTNATATKAIVNNYSLFEVVFANTTTRQNIFTNRSVTHSVIRNTPNAMTFLNDHSKAGQRISSGISDTSLKGVTKNMFVLYVQFESQCVEILDNSTTIFKYVYSSWEDEEEVPAESSEQIGSGSFDHTKRYHINKFATKVGVRAFGWMDTGLADSTLRTWRYVDFS